MAASLASCRRCGFLTTHLRLPLAHRPDRGVAALPQLVHDGKRAAHSCTILGALLKGEARRAEPADPERSGLAGLAHLLERERAAAEHRARCTWRAGSGGLLATTCLTDLGLLHQNQPVQTRRGATSGLLVLLVPLLGRRRLSQELPAVPRPSKKKTMTKVQRKRLPPRPAPYACVRAPAAHYLQQYLFGECHLWPTKGR